MLFFQNHEDVRFSGHASFVGKSAMEVSIMVDQKTDQGGYLKCIESVFLLVARDTLGTGPARINPLVAENKEEEEFLKRRAGIVNDSLNFLKLSCSI